MNFPTIYPTEHVCCSGRTLPEIDKELEPTMNKIHEYISEKSTFKNLTCSTAKNFVASMVQNPALGLLKGGYCLLSGYMIYLLVKGTFAGIEVDLDTSFKDLFSKNETIRLNAGLNLTNGEQAGQFLNDSMMIAYTLGYYVLLKKPYHQAMTEIINEAYKLHLDEMQNPDVEMQISPIHCRENINRLYQLQQTELERWH